MQEDEPDRVSRRSLLKVAGLSGAALATSAPPTFSAENTIAPAVQASAGAASDFLLFFNDEEARFVESAIDVLIPADPRWPGAVGAGVLTYIDRQLAGSYGAGARMYLAGPWLENATPEQGYQLRYAPAELYRIAVGEIRELVRRRQGGSEFWELTTLQREDLLKMLEASELELPSLPSAVFFETLLANTVEGYFADPAHGGNRDMTSWRMLGFPGAYAQFADLVEAHGVPYTRAPISFANNAARQDHVRAHRHE